MKLGKAKFFPKDDGGRLALTLLMYKYPFFYYKVKKDQQACNLGYLRLTFFFSTALFTLLFVPTEFVSSGYLYVLLLLFPDK